MRRGDVQLLRDQRAETLRLEPLFDKFPQCDISAAGIFEKCFASRSLASSCFRGDLLNNFGIWLSHGLRASSQASGSCPYRNGKRKRKDQHDEKK